MAIFFSGLNGEEIVGTLYKKNYKKNNNNNNNNKKEFRVEKVIKRKCDKPYVNRKSYGNSFKSWIDKKYVA